MPHLPDFIIEREVAAICERYRILPEDARSLFDNYVQRRPDLLGKILPKVSEQDITRLKAYKTLMKGVRKQVYYYLRQYQPDKDAAINLQHQLTQAITDSSSPQNVRKIVLQLLHTHVSTRERLAHYREFYETLFDIIEPPGTIVDIGCGIHPLSYPYGEKDVAGFSPYPLNTTPGLYVAVDKQPEVIETLRIFTPLVGPTRLVPVCADIIDINWYAYTDEAGVDMFDLVFILKVIPVIARQQRPLLTTLAAIPARRMLVTATTEAMTRKQNIRKREERFLREFIELTDRGVQATFQVRSEFGFLLDLPGTGRAQKFS